MKKSILSLTLVVFLAGPILNVPVAQAVSQAKSHSVKSGAATSKSKHKTKSRGKKAALKSSKSGLNAAERVSATHYVHTPMPPLRAMRSVSADTLQGGEPDLRASAALVVDQKSGAALYAKNIDVPTSIASITKLMTAMVTLDAGLPLDEEIVVGEEDVDRLKRTGSRCLWGRG